MKLNHRMKRTTRQYIIVAIICIVIIGGAAIFTSIIITNQIKGEYENLLTEAYHQISINQREVYLATVNIIAGDIITEDKIKKQTVYSSQKQDSYITKKDIGTMSLIDIPIDTYIMDSMVTDRMISSELREVEYQVININTNIVSNDTVDVRIFFPNGEDYVVLSKKVLRDYTGESAVCYLWLSEEEIIRIRNAIVDAYLYTGAFLYTSKYIEPNVQEATVVTYTPSVGAIELIQKNPNVIEAATNDLSTLVRKALENRLAKSLKKDVTSEQWNLKDDNIYQQYQEGDSNTEDPMSKLGEEESQVNTVENSEITQVGESMKGLEQYFDLPEKKEVEEPGNEDDPGNKDNQVKEDDSANEEDSGNEGDPGNEDNQVNADDTANEDDPEKGMMQEEDASNFRRSPDLGSREPSKNELMDEKYYIYMEGF